LDALPLFRSENSLTPIKVPLRQKELAMLVLTRKLDESIRISDNITITVLRIKGNTVRIGIEAPRDVRVARSELLSVDSEDNQSSGPTVTAIVDSPTIAGPKLYVGTVTEDGKTVALNAEAGDGSSLVSPSLGVFDLDSVLIKDQAAPLRAFLRSGRGLTAV